MKTRGGESEKTRFVQAVDGGWGLPTSTGQWFPFSPLSGFTLTESGVLRCLTEVISARGPGTFCHLSFGACLAHEERHRVPADLAWRVGDVSKPLSKLTPDWIEILKLTWDFFLRQRLSSPHSIFFPTRKAKRCGFVTGPTSKP